MIEEILKWAALVLAAGFVGYFGRYLAMELIRRFRGDDPAGQASGGDNSQAAADVAAKLRKKRLKSELKSAKKRLESDREKEDG